MAKLQALVRRVESVLVAMAATVVETFALLHVRGVVPLGDGVPAGPRVRRLCAAHCNRSSESMSTYCR